jgi:hypothetical protein
LLPAAYKNKKALDRTYGERLCSAEGAIAFRQKEEQPSCQRCLLKKRRIVSLYRIEYFFLPSPESSTAQKESNAIKRIDTVDRVLVTTSTKSGEFVACRSEP